MINTVPHGWPVNFRSRSAVGGGFFLLVFPSMFLVSAHDFFIFSNPLECVYDLLWIVNSYCSQKNYTKISIEIMQNITELFAWITIASKYRRKQEK